MQGVFLLNNVTIWDIMEVGFYVRFGWRKNSMDCVPLIEFGEYLNNVVIPDIPSDTNFWLVRSKSGYFYDEFISGRFVALGWNYITKDTSFDKKNIEILKDQIKERYGDLRPGVAVNKCVRFIEEVKSGDYVLIPSVGGTEVTIGILGDYYEEDFDYLDELVAIKKIENRETEIGKVKCPYKKRRHMNKIMAISSQRLGYKILKGMSSYHGISNMNEYAIDILNCIYDCYTYNDNMMYSLNIAKKEPIKARELSKLMYGVTELFCNLTDEDLVSVTVNLNSPGKITVVLENGYQKLKKGAIPVLAIYLFVFGGSGFGFEFPGLAGGIINTIKEYRTMDLEVELKEADLKGKQLKNYKEALEVIKMSKESDVDIDIDKVLKDLELVDGLNDSLKFESNQQFATSDKKDIEER